MSLWLLNYKNPSVWRGLLSDEWEPPREGLGPGSSALHTKTTVCTQLLNKNGWWVFPLQPRELECFLLLHLIRRRHVCDVRNTWVKNNNKHWRTNMEGRRVLFEQANICGYCRIIWPDYTHPPLTKESQMLADVGVLFGGIEVRSSPWPSQYRMVDFHVMVWR